MTWDHIEGYWKQMQGRARRHWGKLTNDELNLVEGKRRELIGRIQGRYGIARDDAERQVDGWLQNLS